VIVKGRLIPFPGAELALETAPPADALAVMTALVRGLDELLVPLRVGVELRRRVDGELRVRELELRLPAAQKHARGSQTVELPSFDGDAIASWWTRERVPDEALALLSFEEALFRAPDEIDGLDLGFTLDERVDVPIIRDERGRWIDARGVTLPSEAPVTVQLVAAHRLTLDVHWSQWLVPGNPLSALFQRTVTDFIADGWTNTSCSEHWTDRMREHYRE